MSKDQRYHVYYYHRYSCANTFDEMYANDMAIAEAVAMESSILCVCVYISPEISTINDIVIVMIPTAIIILNRLDGDVGNLSALKD